MGHGSSNGVTSFKIQWGLTVWAIDNHRGCNFISNIYFHLNFAFYGTSSLFYQVEEKAGSNDGDYEGEFSALGTQLHENIFDDMNFKKK